MTPSTHTPGPRTLAPSVDGSCVYVHGGSQPDWPLAAFYGPAEVAMANATLDAAAPEMLDALKACVFECADFEHMTDECAAAFRNARAVIDKAEGREG